MIIGITGIPFTGEKDGKTSAAHFLCEEFSSTYVDLMAPVIAVRNSLPPQGGVSLERLTNAICARGRSIDSGFWLNLVIANVPKDKLKNSIFDNLFFYNEYLFVKKNNGVVIEISSGKSPSNLDFAPDYIFHGLTKQELTKKLIEIVVARK
jgi:hypothetical protein